MIQTLPSSFRDPDGSLFLMDDMLYRKIHFSYQAEYDHLLNSGLYARLVQENLLVSHVESLSEFPSAERIYKIIQPERIPFISYPYEWCFSQLRDAALLTLRVMKASLEYRVILKDASAYNVQFQNGKPIFIDSLSFERWTGKPWAAYRQFCEHFLCPLALMSMKDPRLGQLLRIFLDGVPLDLTRSLLPARTILNWNLLLNVHLHALGHRYLTRPNGCKTQTPPRMSLTALRGLIDGLETAIASLRIREKKSMWSDYQNGRNYSLGAADSKEKILLQFLDEIRPSRVWDLGANDGFYSRLAASRGAHVVSIDSDPACVESNYRECLRQNQARVLPLCLDLVNPSPGLGWNGEERTPLIERGPADLALALALIHHLFITHHLPWERLVVFFESICEHLVVEYVPKEDPMAQVLLYDRRDDFATYTEDDFKNAFAAYFEIRKIVPIQESKRKLYWMTRKAAPRPK